VILISQDLDEILEISNKVAFLSEGGLSKPIDSEKANMSEIGALMGGLSKEDVISNG
jgi:ABC-type uncharacterized transport system ATPase subunit